MFKEYSKTTLRNTIRNKGHSFINITGLAIGMACSILIFLYIFFELSYDKYHKKADQIYRVVENFKIKDRLYKSPILPGPLATLMQEEIPEVENTVRIYSGKNWGESALISYKDKRFHTDRFIYADSSLFKMFTFRFIKGNPAAVFSELQSVVITKKMADKYFASEDPIGKTISYKEKYEFKITGVIEDIPPNSHFRFDFVAPLKNYFVIRSEQMGNWSNSAFFTYVEIPKNYDPKEFEKKLMEVLHSHRGKGGNARLWLQPITHIHLHSNLRVEFEDNGDIRFIYIFTGIAVLVLIIACLNFINLSTARSLNRAKEVGMRKVVGANRNQLISQFLNESIILNLVALIIAILLVILFLPTFRNITGNPVDLTLINNPSYAFILLIIVFFTGFVSGIFPALFFSAFNPISVLKENFNPGIGTFGKSPLRSWVVIVQFVISICLITCTGVIYNQMDYVHNKDLGFTKKEIVVISTRQNSDIISKIEVLKSRFLEHPGILAVSASSHTPGNRLWNRSIRIEGEEPDKWIPIKSLWVDHDFIETYEIKLKEGRSFSKSFVTDEKNAFILNETAVQKLGFLSAENAIGKRIYLGSEKEGSVIGVAKDFHFMSLHSPVESTIIHIDPQKFYFISVRINTKNIPSMLSFLKKKWAEIIPDQPFDYFFMGREYLEQYRADQVIGTIMSYFSLLAVFISCLGLFGLATFMAERYTKEIGIRKVLGASASNAVGILLMRFLKGIFVSTIIAWPIAYFAMNKWLQGFAYRISISLEIFIFSTVIVLVIALLSVCYQVIKTANLNPVEVLKYE